MEIAWTCWLVANGVGFLAFAWDKWRATRRGRRTPEATLIAVAALAAPGCWLAMGLLRHKTRKPWFRWKMIAASAVDAAWLAGLVALYAR